MPSLRQLLLGVPPPVFDFGTPRDDPVAFTICAGGQAHAGEPHAVPSTRNPARSIGVDRAELLVQVAVNRQASLFFQRCTVRTSRRGARRFFPGIEGVRALRPSRSVWPTPFLPRARRHHLKGLSPASSQPARSARHLLRQARGVDLRNYMWFKLGVHASQGGTIGPRRSLRIRNPTARNRLHS